MTASTTPAPVKTVLLTGFDPFNGATINPSWEAARALDGWSGPGLGDATWPEFETAPALAFVDVDGTLLAETTTYLFARILRRRGMIKRSFVLRALYHGLQHRFGRLDYGRLVAFGLKSIASVPPELARC